MAIEVALATAALIAAAWFCGTGVRVIGMLLIGRGYNIWRGDAMGRNRPAAQSGRVGPVAMSLRARPLNIFAGSR